MKIQIVRNKDDKAAPTHTKVTLGELAQIGQSGCIEINAGDVLDYVPDKMQAINHLVERLRYDGELIITGTDLLAVSTALSHGSLDYQTATALLYSGKANCTTLEAYRALAKNTPQVSIVKQNLTQYKYTIVFKRIKG
jgi:hypothetical protein